MNDLATQKQIVKIVKIKKKNKKKRKRSLYEAREKMKKIQMSQIIFIVQNILKMVPCGVGKYVVFGLGVCIIVASVGENRQNSGFFEFYNYVIQVRLKIILHS